MIWLYLAGFVFLVCVLYSWLPFKDLDALDYTMIGFLSLLWPLTLLAIAAAALLYLVGQIIVLITRGIIWLFIKLSSMPD